MFEFFRKHTWLLQVVLAFVVIAFVGTSVYQGYGRMMGDEEATVAHIDGRKLTRSEWEFAQREQIDRIRRQMPNVDPKLFDTPEMKRQSLDLLVRERVTLAAADKLNLSVTNERLQRELMNVPQLASLRRADGTFDFDTYKMMLQAQGYTPASFEGQLRQDLLLRQVFQGLNATPIAPTAVAAAALDAMYQQREVQVQRFNAKDSADKVAPTDADIEKYYKDPLNAAQFTAPETASVEYVVLDLAAIKKGITVSDKDLREYYTANEKRYTTVEERRASHILVKADKDASADVKAKAKAKAEALLAEVKKNPASFAEVARKNSDDDSSASKGGDLEFSARDGLAAKPLADAVFSLKVDEIGPLVETEFGYHIVKLTAIRGGDKRPFDAVRAEIESEVQTQLAQKRYSEAAVEFSNMVEDQSDSLKPAVDKFKLELRSGQDVHRAAAPGASGALANPKFLEALFGNDAVRNKRNTQAIEIAPSTMASGRIVKYEAAHQLPLADVKAKVRERVVAQQSAALARKLGEARLAELKAAPATTMSEPTVTVSRAQPKDLGGVLLDAVLKAPAAKPPAFVGVDLGEQGYAVARIGKVLGRDPQVADATRAQREYAQAWGDAETRAYYAALKQRFNVDIKPAVLAATDPSGAASAVVK